MNIELFATQEFPFPDTLNDLVNRLKYRPGWRFKLQYIDRGQGSKGLTLDVITSGYNSYHPEQGQNYSVHHYMPVPPASYNERSWRRWLLEQCILVDRHEACEFFVIEEDEEDKHPYAPNHGPGNDPYIIFEYSTDEDARTNFRGVVKDAN